MKYLKYFEKENFKTGDTVICIDDFISSGGLKKGDFYEVKDINTYGNLRVNNRYWYPTRFRLATPEEIQAKKYNL